MLALDGLIRIVLTGLCLSVCGPLSSFRAVFLVFWLFFVRVVWVFTVYLLWIFVRGWLRGLWRYMVFCRGFCYWGCFFLKVLLEFPCSCASFWLWLYTYLGLLSCIDMDWCSDCRLFSSLQGLVCLLVLSSWRCFFSLTYLLFEVLPFLSLFYIYVAASIVFVCFIGVSCCFSCVFGFFFL